jgi:general secretion pathway protein B
MSYILDALKKLEHEKSRKSRGDGMVNISGALFEYERTKPSGTPGWKIALAVTVAVLLTFGATWLLLRPTKVQVKPVLRPASQTPPTSPMPAAPQAAVGSAPRPVEPQVAPVQQTPAASPTAPAQVTPVRAPAQAPKQQEAAAQAAPADDDEESESHRRRKERRGQVLPADQAATAAPAEIKLSGIAWQEERRARRAVVNGFLMQEGGVVSGARITDIFQDRVRFSLSGKVFEIPLISSAVPAAGK